MNYYSYLYSIEQTTMERIIPVKSKDYHKAMLMLWNFSLNLSPMEIDIVSCVLNHNMEIIDVNSRKTLRQELDKDEFIINNYISRLKNKGVFITKPADKHLYVNPNIIEMVKEPKITFNLELTD